MKKMNSKNQIRKYILKRGKISPKTKRYVLKDFNQIMKTLETQNPYPLIVKQTNYRITTTGRNLLSLYGAWDSEEKKPSNTLHVWTETDLEKLVEKRVRKNINKNIELGS
jgi:hypothetical protein